MAMRTRGSTRPVRTTRLALLGALLVAVLIAGTTPLPAAAAPTAVAVASVTTAHPRLISNAAGFSATSGLIASDDTARAWYGSVKKKADGFLAVPPLTYDMSSGTLENTARGVSERVYALGFVWKQTGDARYADRLWAELSAAAAFPNWNPDKFLDTAEMAQGVSVGYDWLYPFLTASQRTTLRTALVDKALTPALAAYSSSAAKYAWTKQASNWNVVSGSGIGMAALAVADTDPAVAQKALDAVTASLPYGLAGYGSDGGYAEGITYWQYATRYLTSYIASLRASTGADGGLLATTGLRASARWATALTGPSGRLFNFGDAWTNESLTTPLVGLQYLYADDSWRSRAIVGIDPYTADDPTARSLLWYRPAVAAATSTPPLDAQYPSAGVTTMRSGWNQEAATWAALRATTGAVIGHSDLDNGSFVLDAQGVNWFGELGADSYGLPGYFDLESGDRWDYYRKRAEGSNTMVFGPDGGPDSATTPSASQSLVASTADRSAAVADLASTDQQLTSWKRGVSLIDGRSQVLVQDEVSGAAAADSWWFAHTRADIAVAADGRSAVLSLEGKQLLARIVSPGTSTFARMDATPLITSPAPAGQDANSHFSKLAIHLEGQTAYTLAVQFTPLRPGIVTPAPAPLRALSSWGATAAETAAPTLKYLAVNNVALPAFSPLTRTYDVTASAKAVPPTVQATAPTGSTATVVQAQSVPGVATVTVSKPGVASAMYRVHLGRGEIAAFSATASVNPTLAARTIDGASYTRWSATTDAYLQYDLGFAQTLNHLEIVWRSIPTAGQYYEVQLSTDRTTWTTVYTGQVKTVEQRAWASFQSGPRTGRYVRVVTHGDKASDRSAVIDEVEFFGDNDAKLSPAPVTAHATGSVSLGMQTVQVGESTTLTSSLTAADGSVPTSGFDTRYVSSDPAVATVSADGRVQAVRPGAVRLGAESRIGRDLVVRSVGLTVVDDKVLTLAPVEDTWVQGGTTTNYSRDRSLTVRHHALYPQFDRLAYMKFDLTGIDPATVATATLGFDAAVVDTTGSEVDVEAWATKGSWAGTTVTYDTRPTMTYRAGSVRVDSTKAPRTLDLTDYARATAGTVTSIGLTEAARPDGLGLVVRIDSLESSYTKPSLTITRKPADQALPAAPVITSATSDYGSAGFVSGSVSGTAGVPTMVDVFAQSGSTCAPDRSAGVAVGSVGVTPDDSGTATFSLTGAFAVGDRIVATASAGGSVSVPSDCTVAAARPDATKTLTISASADTWVTGSAPTGTYGRDPVLQVRHLNKYPETDRVAYLAFDLSKIPAGSIRSATMTIGAVVDDTRGTAIDVAIRSVASPWSASTMTWNTRPAMEGLVASMPVDSVKAPRTVDLTDYVASRPRTMTGIGFVEPDQPSGIGLVVKLDSMESTAKPTLTVVYTPA